MEIAAIATPVHPAAASISRLVTRAQGGLSRTFQWPGNHRDREVLKYRMPRERVPPMVSTGGRGSQWLPEFEGAWTAPLIPPGRRFT